MAGIYTPTPFQNALFDPRKPLQQLAEKKCPCALAHAPVMRAREVALRNYLKGLISID
jgi:hypothetical protein